MARIYTTLLNRVSISSKEREWNLTLSLRAVPLLTKERDVSATPKQGAVKGKALRSMLPKSSV